MKPLSLAVVRQRYTDDGGAERFVARALTALRAQGVGVTLIARRWKGAPDYKTVTCNPFYLGRLWRDWSFARAVCRTLRAQSFDLVQSHERLLCCDIYRAGDGVHAEWLQQRARVLAPATRFAQRLNPYHRYLLSTERQLFTGARLKAVICNSRMVKHEIMHRFGTAPEKLHVIYNGVDLEVFHPRLAEHRSAVRARHNIPQDAVLFLFVGSGFERKGASALLDALARLPANAYALIVGRDRRAAKYEAQAKALGLTTRAIFVGSQSDVKPYYGAADAFVLPTLYDPFPNVIVEALASGLPVVTSTKSGGAELIDVGRNGFVCDALDIDALAESMRQLMKPELRAAARVAARASVEHLDLMRMAQQLHALYQQLMRD